MLRAQNTSARVKADSRVESTQSDSGKLVETSPRRGRLARRSSNPDPSLLHRLRDPRSVVLLLMTAVLVFGGGRKLLRARLARKAVARLDDPDVTTDEIVSVARFGRTGLFELFQRFGSDDSPAKRQAAGQAIARLWADDQLVAEEEQAFAKRSYDVQWHARRRFPRALRREIPIAVTYGLPLLKKSGEGISSANLEWSHRIVGARRATLEQESPWKSGEGRVEFTLIPEDFETNGPHQIVLETKVRTAGLTGSWQIELPKMPFRFDFDPNLVVESLLTLPDAEREERITGAIRLEAAPISTDGATPYLSIHEALAIRNPPWIVIDGPLPSDLSHTLEIEIEGIAGRCPAGRVITCGQDLPSMVPVESREGARRFPLGPIAEVPASSLERPGNRRIRVHLKADPELGWGSPEIRSVWPGEITTNWEEVEITRR